MPPPEIGRDLLITLALVAEGVDAIVNLRDQVAGIKQEVSGEATLTLDLVVKGLKDAIALFQGGQIGAEELDRTVKGLTGSFELFESSLGGFGGLGSEKLQNLNVALKSVQTEAAKTLDEIRDLRSAISEIRTIRDKAAEPNISTSELDNLGARLDAIVQSIPELSLPVAGEREESALEDRARAAIERRKESLVALGREEIKRRNEIESLTKVEQERAVQANRAIQNIGQALKSEQRTLEATGVNVDSLRRVYAQLAEEAPEAFRQTVLEMRRQQAALQQLRDAVQGTAIFGAGGGSQIEAVKQAKLIQDAASLVPDLGPIAFGDPESIAKIDRLNKSLVDRLIPALRVAEGLLGEQGLNQFLREDARNLEFLAATSDKATAARERFNASLSGTTVPVATDVQRKAQEEENTKRAIDRTTQALKQKEDAEKRAVKAIDDHTKENKEAVKEENKRADAVKKTNAEVERTGRRGANRGLFGGLFAAIGGEGGRDQGFRQALGFSAGRLGLYSIAATAIFTVQRAARAAVRDLLDFDTVLAEIRGVLPSRSDFESFIIGQTAINSALEYGFSLRETADSAKIFAQTGQNAAEVAESLSAALSATRGANLPIGQARDLIIAIQNISEGEVEALDILNRISRVESRRAITAVDLANAIQRLGPLVRELRGDMVGLVDEFDFAMGTVTEIVEQTRVSGQNAANSVKFILSRLGRPDILRQLQTLSGVELARPGGRELRPALEILQEISIAYLELIETGQSAKAFELATVLGGARQLQAVAALLENFGGVLETSRISALAFNDTEERTAINLDTISAKLQRTATAFSALFAAIGQTTTAQAVFGGTLEFIIGILDTFTQATNDISGAISQLTGGNRFAVDFINVEDIDPTKLSRLNEYVKIANNANLTTEQLTNQVVALSNVITSQLSERFGASVQELNDIIASGNAGDTFRGLREEIGEQLARSLALSIPRIRELNEALESATDPAERAAIRAERLSTVYSVLGDAVFSTNAIIASNSQRIEDSAIVVSNELTRSLNEYLKRANDARISSEQNQGFISPGVRAGLEQITRDIGAAKNFARNAFRDLSRELPQELQPVLNAFISTNEAINAMGRAIQGNVDLSTGVVNLGAALDDFALGFLANSKNREETIERLKKQIIEVLELRDIPVFSVAGGLPGEQFLRTQQQLVAQVISGIKTSLNLTDEQADVLRELEQFLTSSFTSSVENLNTFTDALVKVRQRLLETLTTFAINIDNAEQLGSAYERIGIAFDITTERFNAGKKTLEDLIGIQNSLRKEIVLAETELFGFQSTTTGATGSTQALAQASDRLKAIIAATGLDDAFSDPSKRIENIRAKIAQMRVQLVELQDGGFLDIFPDTEEGRRIEQTFLRILSLGEGQEIEALRNLESLIAQQEQFVANELRILTERERNLIAIKAQGDATRELLRVEQERVNLQAEGRTAALNAESGRLQQILDLTISTTDNVRARIRTEQELFNLQSSKIRSTLALQESQIDTTLREEQAAIRVAAAGIESEEVKTQLIAAQVKAEQERQKALDDSTSAQNKLNQTFEQTRADILGDNLISAFSGLANQIQSNVDSATSGLRQVLTDLNSINTDFLANLLGPIGETFINRAAENFTKTLFDSTSDTFLGRISAAFGAGPETRLKTALEEAFALGSNTVEAKMISGSEIGGNILRASIISATGGGAAAGLSPEGAALLGRIPEPEIGLAGTNLVGFGTAVERATKDQKDASIQINRLASNFGTLASALASNAIFGNTASTQIGAQFGSAVGTIAGEELLTGLVGGALGGPVGALAGSLLGAGIGSLFGGDGDTQSQQLSSLSKIEENTRRSADTLELERRFNEVARGAFNVPSSFVLPQFLPLLGSQRSFVQSNTVEATIVIQDASNPQAIVETIRAEFGPMIQQELATLGV